MAARLDYKMRERQRRYRERHGEIRRAYQRAWMAHVRLYTRYLPRALQTIAELCDRSEW